MHRPAARLALLPLPALLILSLTAVAALADDWPQWRGPDRTGHVAPGVPVPATLPAAPNVVWHVPVGFSLGSPVVSGGRVFYLDIKDNKEVAHAADAATGKPVWSAELDDAHKDGQSAAGPRGTPVVDGDRVYAQSCKGELQCLAAADGTVVWKTNYVKDFGATYIGEKGQAQGATRHGYTAPPVVDGDHLIALVGGKDGAGVVCFDKATGHVVWKSQDETPAYAAPVVATVAGTRQLVAFMVQGVIGLNPADGKFLWRFPVKTALGRHAATPVVVDDPSATSGSSERSRTGQAMVVVGSHQAGLIGIKVTRSGDEFKAEQAWVGKDVAPNFASPVAVGRHVYGLGPSQNLFCVDAGTGQKAWSKEGYFTGSAAKAYAGLLVMGPNLAVVTDDGQLLLIATDPAACREVGRARVCGTNWCLPAYADGRLFVRDAKELRCVQLMP